MEVRLLVASSLMAILSTACAPSSAIRWDGGDCPCVCEITDDWISKVCQAANLSTTDVWGIERNSLGDQLRVRRSDEMLVLVGAEGFQTMSTQGKGKAYLRDELDSAAWFDKGLIHFETGVTIASEDVQFFAIDPGAQFFLLRLEKGKTELRRAERPLDTLFTLLHRTEWEDCEWIFAEGNNVFVFSRTYSERKGPGDYKQDGVVCQVLRLDGDTVELRRNVTIPRPTPAPSPFVVLDMDTQCGKVLLVDRRDPPFAYSRSAIYVFDLDTSALTALGSQGHSRFLFLEKSLCKEIENSSVLKPDVKSGNNSRL